MSDLVEDLARYVVTVPQTGAAALDEAHRRVVDTVGVAIGGWSSAPARSARRVALHYASAQHAGAYVWGVPSLSAPGEAGFANGVAVRYLDFNDAYFGLGGCHPSDMISGLFALAEDRHRDPDDLLDAIAVGYEVCVALSDTFRVHDNGWDHVNTLQIGAACAAARLLGLTMEEAAHAISLTVVPHSAMRQTRVGQIGRWKAAAAAESVRNAVFATLLAADGMEGPNLPFTGSNGFFALLLGRQIGRSEWLRHLDPGQSPEKILRTHMKRWPVGYVAQSAVQAGIALSKDIRDFAEVKSVGIRTYDMALWRMDSPEKRAPQTRETADHSLAYVTYCALRDGWVGASTFEPESFSDRSVHAFLQADMSIFADEEMNALYPKRFPAEVVVTLADGSTRSCRVDSPSGHALNKFSGDDLEEKFRETAAGLLDARSLESVLAACHGLREPDGVRRLGKVLGGLQISQSGELLSERGFAP